MKKTLLLKLLAILIMAWATPGLAADPAKISDEERILTISAKALSGESNLSAKALYEIAASKDPNYLIASLQPLDEYNNGHVPGAVHLTVNLADLAGTTKDLPKNKTILLVSTNGQEACKVALILRQLGYEARHATLGMNAYNRLHAGTGAYMGDIDGEISIEAAEFQPASPQRNYSELSDQELIRQRTEAYAKQRRPFSITAYDLPEMKDALLISMQRPEDYAKGHIPGTINIPGPDFIAGDKRLLELPKDKKIIVTCYIGHYSSLGAMMLNQMGYEAYSLAWGLAGWNITAMGGEIKVPLTKGFGYEVAK